MQSVCHLWFYAGSDSADCNPREIDDQAFESVDLEHAFAGGCPGNIQCTRLCSKAKLPSAKVPSSPEYRTLAAQVTAHCWCRCMDPRWVCAHTRFTRQLAQQAWTGLSMGPVCKLFRYTWIHMKAWINLKARAMKGVNFLEQLNLPMSEVNPHTHCRVVRCHRQAYMMTRTSPFTQQCY